MGSHAIIRAVTDSQRILDSIRRLVRLLRLSDSEAQATFGLSAAQLFALHAIASMPRLSVNDLAERTQTDQSSVSVVVGRLVDAGLVARERAEDDARRVVLEVTKEGRALLRKAPPVAPQRIVAIVDALPATTRKRFADTFVHLIRELDPTDDRPPLLFSESRRKRKQS